MKKNYKKVSILLLSTFAMLFFFISTNAVLKAEDIDKLLDQQNSASKQYKQDKNGYDQAVKDINDNDNLLNKINNQISSISNNIVSLESRITSERNQLKKQLQVMQKSNSFLNLVDFVINAKSFNDLIERTNATITISKNSQQKVTNYINDKKQLEIDKENLNKRKLQAAEFKKTLEIRKIEFKNKFLDDEKKLQEIISSIAFAYQGQNYTGSIHWPATCSNIIQPFGRYVNGITLHGGAHDGIDIACNHGSPIFAVAPGKVSNTFSGCSSENDWSCADGSGGYGNHVFIDSLVNGTKVRFIYGHLKPGGVKVNTGDLVAPGQVIGFMGSTGHSYSTHLHFGTYSGSQLLNPLQFISK